MLWIQTTGNHEGGSEIANLKDLFAKIHIDLQKNILSYMMVGDDCSPPSAVFDEWIQEDNDGTFTAFFDAMMEAGEDGQHGQGDQHSNDGLDKPRRMLWASAFTRARRLQNDSLANNDADQPQQHSNGDQLTNGNAADTLDREDRPQSEREDVGPSQVEEKLPNRLF